MASDTPQDDERSELEKRFLAGGEADEPDEFDEELLELTQTRNRGSVLRPILMIIVILLVGSVLHDWQDELGYFFTSSEPVEIGDPSRFSQIMQENPEWEPPVAHNQYVSIEGMPSRISRGGQYELFRLIGGEIYVQRQLDDDGTGEQEGLPERGLQQGLPIDEHRQRYEGTGRMVSFAAVPDRVAGLKEFYGERYNLRFCEDFTPRQIEDLERQRLENFRANWHERYQRASDEERDRRGLTPEPTEADEQQNLERHPICVDAYLVHDGQRPIDHWWYVLLSVLLSAFVVFNIFKLYSWFRDWLRP